MKLHLGAGTVYLKGYINIDAAPHYMAYDSPKELLEKNSTTLDRYYKYDFCKGPGVCIADLKTLIDELPYDDKTIEEIVLVHVLEHLPTYKRGKTLKELNRVLKFGAKFYVAVPDIKETARLLGESKTPKEEDWNIRLIYGTQRNEFSHHYCGYTIRTLKDLLAKYGFGEFNLLPNKNFYPAIHMECYKLKDYR